VPEKATLNEMLGTPGLLDEVNDGSVYHYTTFETLKSILDTKSLHLSYIACLNDYTEFEAAIHFFCDKLRSSEKNRQKYQEVIKFIEEKLLQVKRNNYCVFSCCLEKDLLSQWRAYSDDGHGLTIGFDAKVIKAICDQNGFFFGKCFYFEASKEDKLKKIILEFRQRLDNHDNQKNINDFFTVSICLFALFFKNEHFREEKEVRIVTPADLELNIKQKNKNITSFYSLDITGKLVELIKEIVIGPCSRSLEMSKAVEVLLKKAKIKDCIITESSIPYRSVRTLQSE
jgi:hypothetical protein